MIRYLLVIIVCLLGTSAIQLPAVAVFNFAFANTCDSEAPSEDQQDLSKVGSGRKRKISEPNHDRGVYNS